MRKLVLKMILPIEKLIAAFSRPVFKIKSSEIEKILPILRNGMILLSRTDWELSNLVLPGMWKHSAVYFGGYVYEATTEGVQRVLAPIWFATRDHVGIVQPEKSFSDAQFMQGIKYLESCLGEDYDYGFDLDTDVLNRSEPHMFCSGYVYGWLRTMDSEWAAKFKLTSLLIEKTIEPGYFWTAIEFFKPVKKIN